MEHMQIVAAVYEDGVLKLQCPLRGIAIGDRVEVAVVRVTPIDHNAPEEVARRERAFKEFDERTKELADAEPDDDYDIAEALNANRLREDARPLIPPTIG